MVVTTIKSLWLRCEQQNLWLSANSRISLEKKRMCKIPWCLSDPNLSWKHHITYQNHKSQGIFARLRQFVPSTTTLNISFSYTTSLVQRCGCLGPSCSVKFGKWSLIQQKRALCWFISNPLDSTLYLCKLSNFLPLNIVFAVKQSILLCTIYWVKCNSSKCFQHIF